MRINRGRVVLLLCVFLLVFNLGRMAVSEFYDFPGPLRVSRTLVIPPGGTAGAADVLAADQAISHRWVFRLGAWFTRGQGPVHAGEFLIPARSSLRQVLGILRFGAVVEHPAMIPEGLTAAQIVRLINDLPDMTGAVAALPEGGLLPQTYDYTRGTPRGEIVERAAAAMEYALAKAWNGREPTNSFTAPDQAVILASIVQEETPVAAELPRIAAVYENRLAQGMDLQADPTVIYAASGGATAAGPGITRADLANPSPYNTYAHAGLPPGPICAPGLAAIEAVLHPAASADLYFVATGTGGHMFARTFKQHLANVAAYRAALQH